MISQNGKEDYMSHSHNKHGHSHDHSNVSNIKLAFLLNFGFTILEIIGGILTNSVAILSDAVHDLGDSLSLGLAWFFGSYSEKEHNKKYTYGYRRYSLLSALINTVVLIIGSFFVLMNSIPRLFSPEQPSTKGMIGFAVVGIIVNGIGAFKTRGSHSLNERVVSWHLLEDVLGWVAVLIVGIIMLFKEIPILDPILSIAITLYILFNVFSSFKETILLFLQTVPSDVDIEDLITKFQNIENVVGTHHTHVWSLDSEHHVLSTHLRVNSTCSLEDILKIKREARELLSGLNIEHLTIEIELENADCSMHKLNKEK